MVKTNILEKKPVAVLCFKDLTLVVQFVFQNTLISMCWRTMKYYIHLNRSNRLLALFICSLLPTKFVPICRVIVDYDVKCTLQ